MNPHHPPPAVPPLLRCLVLLVGLAPTVRAQPASTSGHAHGHAAMSSHAKPAGPELGASAAFDSAGRLWAAHKSEGHVAVSRSDDRGRSWSPPVRVTPAPEATDPGGDARPRIALGSAGEIYVTWTRALAKPYTGEIRFSRSLDGGRSFAGPIVVHRDRAEITHRFDALALDRAGHLYVGWIDKRDAIAAAAASQPYRGAAVYYAVSDDRGGTFRGDFKIADHACECCRLALAPLPAGGAAVLWRHVFAPNIRDHASALLGPEGQVREFRRETFDDWRTDACPHHGPSLAISDDGARHAVWFSATPAGASVSYASLGPTGLAASRRIGGRLAAHADLAVHGRRLVVAWKEFEDGLTRLRALASDDGGGTWRQSELRATAGASGHPLVLSQAGRFFVFWPTAAEPLSVSPLP